MAICDFSILRIESFATSLLAEPFLATFFRVELQIFKPARAITAITEAVATATGFSDHFALGLPGTMC